MRSINFMGHRKLTLALSCLLVILSITSLATRQISWGLDFTGGTLLELHFSQAVNLDAVRGSVTAAGHRSAVVVAYGTDRDVLIRLPQDVHETAGAGLVHRLQRDLDADLQLKRQEFVGPQVGSELREQGGLAMLLASALIMLYISFRFQARFAAAAVIALVHDVVITLGFLSIAGLEFNLTVLAAILAVIGYSINDTIVVFDRIRENFRKLRLASAIETINLSVNETFERTLVTSLTTLLVLIALAIFGGEMIFGFACALLVGVGVGTYSSVFVASNLLLIMGVSRQDLLPPPAAEDGGDASP